MSEKETVLKKALSDFLGFLKYKVDNDLLTMEEAQSFKDAIDSSLPVRGTVKDLAGYFG